MAHITTDKEEIELIKGIFKKPFSLEQLTELIEKYRPQV
jgi:hypothetical protein